MTDRQRVAVLLRELRSEVGDSRFGYRAQGLFAHVLKEIGASEIEVRRTGHPDIVALLGGSRIRFEVEIASVSKRHHVVKADDVEGIAPRSGGNERGYLAVLDIVEPVRWTAIEYSRIRHRLGRQPLATLHALADRELAGASNAAFFEIINRNAERLPALTFSRLCQGFLPQDS